MKDVNSKPQDKPDNERKPVTVTVDDNEIQVEGGKYLVSEFKSKVGVPADYDLDQLVKGKFETLIDTAAVRIIGKEIFVSHVRTGGSSSD